MPISSAVLDLLFPPKCPFCGKLLEKGQLLCPACQRDLPWLTGAAAERAVELTDGCLAPLRYQGAVREAIHRYKFGGKSARSRPFGLLIAQCIQDHGVEADLITWAPLSKRRLRRRGYDQAELLARTVGQVLSLPVLPTLAKREVPAQSGLEEEAQRRSNVLGAYSALEPSPVPDRRVLLIDDVVTSGSTLSECAKVLRLAGARSVQCAVLARAR